MNESCTPLEIHEIQHQPYVELYQLQVYFSDDKNVEILDFLY